MSEKVTLKSLADALGVSVSTVSKALNDSPRLKDETKRLVHDKAKELNYRPNYFAKSLRNMNTNTIGIILSDLQNPANMNMIRRIMFLNVLIKKIIIKNCILLYSISTI